MQTQRISQRVGTSVLSLPSLWVILLILPFTAVVVSIQVFEKGCNSFQEQWVWSNWARRDLRLSKTLKVEPRIHIASSTFTHIHPFLYLISLNLPTEAHHRFIAEEMDWGFTRFSELRKLGAPAEGRPAAVIDNRNGGSCRISAFVRVLKDETGVLWHNFIK